MLKNLMLVSLWYVLGDHTTVSDVISQVIADILDPCLYAVVFYSVEVRLCCSLLSMAYGNNTQC